MRVLAYTLILSLNIICSPGHTGDLDEAIAKLDAEDWTVRQDAAILLGEFDHPRAIAALANALDDLESEVYIVAAASLVRNCGKHSQQLSTELSRRQSSISQSGLEIFFRMALAPGADCDGTFTRDIMSWGLRNGGWRIRFMLARHVGSFDVPNGLKFLKMALDDQFPEIRAVALRSVQGPMTSDVVDEVLKALRKGEPDVRQAAAGALGKLEDSSAVEPLINVLSDPDLGVRSAAAKSLGILGNVRAIDPLTAILDDRDANVRKEAVDALGRLGARTEIPKLTSLLTDWLVAETAATTLDQLGWQPHSDEEKVHLWIARRDIRKLKMEWSLTQSVLLSDLRKSDPQKTANAIYAIIGLGEQTLIDDAIGELYENGNKIMAETYLNSGHEDLKSAGYEWANRNGMVVLEGKGASPVKWGAM